MRSGPAAAALLTLAALLFLADGLQMDAAAVRESRYDVEALDDRVVHVDQQRAFAGDIVEAYPERLLAAPFSHYDFLIVPGGQGQGYAHGNGSSQVLHEVRGLDPDACCRHGPVHFTKPATGDPQWIDLVWIFYYAQDMQRPAEGPARDYFDQWVTTAATAGGESPGGRSTVVVKEWGVEAHRWLTGLGLASAVLGASALAAWAWRERAPPAAQAGPGGLVDLVQAGRLYLRRLASLLLVLLVPILLAGWAAEAWASTSLVEMTGPRRGWFAPIIWGVRIVWLAVAAAWLLQWLRVRQRLRAWEQGPQV